VVIAEYQVTNSTYTHTPLIQSSRTTWNEFCDLSPTARSQMSTLIKPRHQLRLISALSDKVSALAGYWVVKN